MSEYVSPARAAKMLDVSTATVRRWIRNGILPAVRIGEADNATVRISVDDIRAAMRPCK
jgi:excisionase family DNA binding protein